MAGYVRAYTIFATLFVKIKIAISAKARTKGAVGFDVSMDEHIIFFFFFGNSFYSFLGLKLLWDIYIYMRVRTAKEKKKKKRVGTEGGVGVCFWILSLAVRKERWGVTSITTPFPRLRGACPEHDPTTARSPDSFLENTKISARPSYRL